MFGFTSSASIVHGRLSGFSQPESIARKWTFIRINSRRRRSSVLPIFATATSRSSQSLPGRKVVLIISTRKGGHAFIGQHLAKSLLNKGHMVYLFDVGDKYTPKPISKYLRLAGGFPGFFQFYFGVRADLGALETALGHVGNFDVVYENSAKKVDDVRGICEFAKRKNVKQVCYISSAGTYNYDGNLMPHLEGDDASGGPISIEEYLNNESEFLATSFRPIYIIGPETAKRSYTDYFFDRLLLDQPILIPGTGEELTSLTTVQDVAEMLAAAIGKDLHGQVFNMTSPRCITMDGVARMCAKIVGKEPNIIHYDPNSVESDDFAVKDAFPFRPRHFFADPGKAIKDLGWTPDLSKDATGLESAIQACYDEYLKRNLEKEQKSFAMDEIILRTV